MFSLAIFFSLSLFTILIFKLEKKKKKYLIVSLAYYIKQSSLNSRYVPFGGAPSPALGPWVWPRGSHDKCIHYIQL
jgi:hypothetical protein